MKLILLHGPPGVGKLTVGKELQKLTGFPLFHNHLTVDMLAAVFDFYSAAFAELREEFWLRVMTRAADDGLAGLIFTFVFEPTVMPGFYERLSSSIAAAGGIIYPFQLQCDTEENVRRLLQPDRRRYLKMTSAEFLRGYLARGDYVPPSELPGNVILDTTRLSAADTAKVIVKHLGIE